MAEADASVDANASARTFTSTTQVMQTTQAELVSGLRLRLRLRRLHSHLEFYEARCGQEKEICVGSIHTWNFMKQGVGKKIIFFFFLRLRQVTIKACSH